MHENTWSEPLDVKVVKILELVAESPADEAMVKDWIPAYGNVLFSRSSSSS